MDAGVFGDFVGTYAVDDAGKAGHAHAAGAHGAGLGAGVHDHFGAFFGGELLAGQVGQVEFGVTADVAFGDDVVGVAQDDFIVADQHGAEGAVAAGGGFAGEFKGTLEVGGVVELVDFFGDIRHCVFLGWLFICVALPGIVVGHFIQAGGGCQCGGGLAG